MELSEAIEQLKNLQKDRKSFIEDDAEHDSIFMQDFEAIDTVLQELEHLQKENEELKEHNRKYLEAEIFSAKQIKNFEKQVKQYYIHKDKIREKIEEIKKAPVIINGGRSQGKTLTYGIKLGKMEAYTDLLKEE